MSRTANQGFFHSYDDLWLIDGLRTPLADYCGAFSQVSPTDLGIKAARAVLKRSGVPATDIGSVISGSMAPGDCYQYMLPRHIGLYAGVPLTVPALNVQRICGTGFELFRQAGDQIALGYADAVLVVGTESMTRNPIAAFNHRSGFKLGAPVGFEDFLWEALTDPAPGITMPQTAENLARRYGITRAEVDKFAAQSHARALDARAAGFHAGEIVAVGNEVFTLDDYADRRIRLSGPMTELAQDTHPRISPPSVLATLRPLYPHGVQTGGNSCALADGAAAAIVASGAYAMHGGHRPQARIVAAAVVGVPPEVMGIGPAPAIRLLLDRCGLNMQQIGLFEINEAQGAQIIALERELKLDRDRLNIHGGAIALGHPLAATGVRLTITLARALDLRRQRYGVAAACVGGGQGIALLLENPRWRQLQHDGTQ
ncbi:thiolase family protein [Duganella violaceipulchra]|uniref:Acetyl-CoA C-acetyltransferase n=1 Tax=Duganella violaceipulchra TaxID=2849652 RepID=A0AA41H4F5_9BURK|nr:thiolase family protein [Duganella violaceicalia]MBV6319455.1 thiolase family protein [Duganella violaceicalia]MCP2006734.1 acetyl-CoA C-acetyltransferase [Duganella violaceicalia]